jgi:arylsulfatase A-like enzyme
MKSDVWEGGHRVPFIVSWPKEVKAGSTTGALVCLTDVMATAAEITDYQFKDSEAVDSFSFLPVLKGEKENVRGDVIHHSIFGSFAIREGKWKLCVNPGSGGWGGPGDGAAFKKNGPDSPLNYQLYDMEKDPSETKNLAAENPEVVSTLRKKLQSQIDAGRTTQGAAQQNDVPIVVDKWKKSAKKKKNKK